MTKPSHSDIEIFNRSQVGPNATICATLYRIISAQLSNAQAKLYHGAPVWFLDENPIVGYSIKKAGVALLFWSGQDFRGPGLKAIGKYKAAEIVFVNEAEIQEPQITSWIDESQKIIWDYKNLPKNKGALVEVKR